MVNKKIISHPLLYLYLSFLMPLILIHPPLTLTLIYFPFNPFFSLYYIIYNRIVFTPYRPIVGLRLSLAFSLSLLSSFCYSLARFPDSSVFGPVQKISSIFGACLFSSPHPLSSSISIYR